MAEKTRIRAASRLLMTTILAISLTACGAIPSSKNGASKRPGSGANSAVFNPSPDARQCFSDLGKANVRFSPLPNQTFGGGCTQIDSIKLLDVGTDVTNLGPVKCQLASKFAAWTEYAVKRAARQYLGSELARIETMGTYNCRNIAGSRRISQHAHANAIDISAFVLRDGRRVTVLNDWEGSRDERAFFKAIHGSACKRFGTVLSPDYNAAHRDHLHFDMSGRGYCR